ncbi:hypothetical protein DV735_g3874, partial [Chaetothyriales sp. CBS 134920]
MHKNLLTAASPHFAHTLRTDAFPEGRTNTIVLPWVCPEAFEVFYQAVYSGRVYHAHYYTDVLWLRVFSLAQYTLFEDLLSVAYQRLRDLFNERDPVTWNELLAVDTRFAAAVAYRIVQLHANMYRGPKGHPTAGGDDDDGAGGSFGHAEFVARVFGRETRVRNEDAYDEDGLVKERR